MIGGPRDRARADRADLHFRQLLHRVGAASDGGCDHRCSSFSSSLLQAFIFALLAAVFIGQIRTAAH